MAAESGFFETDDGLRLYYEVHGTGEPVLLLHGFASNLRVNWVSTGWTDHLARHGCMAIAMDHRGHGRSDSPHDPAAYGTRRMAADAARLLDHLGIVAAAVMGYSMGARAAAFLAVDHGERVPALVLAGMAGNLLHGVRDAEAIAQCLEADDAAACPTPRARAFRQFAERTGSDLKALAACMRAGREPLTPEELRSLTMPVLVTVGERDEIAGPPEPLMRWLPNAELVILPGRDHMNAVGDRQHKAAVTRFLGRHWCRSAHAGAGGE